jgi:acyl-CoA dehydrogenase
MVPQALGGEGASVSEIAEICYSLGGACASTAMIYAMHQIKTACVVRHSDDSPWHQDFLRRAARDQLLLASSTTEGQGGGDVRSSSAAIERDGARIALNRAATVMSYGEQADAVVTTARRAPDAATSDQVLVVFEKADYSLARTVEWETLGMRGTRSAGFDLKALGSSEQILPKPYAEIHALTMTPSAHLFWSSVWAGVAASAVDRARLFTRKAARGMGGQTPPGAAHVVAAATALRQLRALVTASLSRYERAAKDPAALLAMDFQTAITLLKVDASELAVTTVMGAMRACGLAGYRNDGDATLGRHLRDILSAPVMINNDRILANAGASALFNDTPKSLHD